MNEEMVISISEEIDSVKKIIARWDRSGTVPEIERDMVLSSLQRVYHSILNIEDYESVLHHPLRQAVSESNLFPPTPDDTTMGDDELNDNNSESHSSPHDFIYDTKEQHTPEVLTPDNINSISEEPTPVPAPDQNDIHTDKKATNEPTVTEEENEVVVYISSDDEESDDDIMEQAYDNKSDEEINTHYKSGAPTVSNQEEATKLHEKPFDTIDRQGFVDRSEDEIVIEPQPVKPEVITLFGQTVSRASVDRFIHELFLNEELFYIHEVSKLADMSDLDSALIYISEKYTWNADSPAAQEFTSLLFEYDFPNA